MIKRSKAKQTVHCPFVRLLFVCLRCRNPFPFSNFQFPISHFSYFPQPSLFVVHFLRGFYSFCGEQKHQKTLYFCKKSKSKKQKVEKWDSQSEMLKSRKVEKSKSRNVETSKSQKRGVCIIGESNPDLYRGRVVFYH